MTFFIRKATAEETYSVRQQELRQGLPLESCIWEGDSDTNTMHWVALCNEKTVGCVSMMFQKGRAYLRAMAVLSSYQKRGVGRLLITALEKELRQRSIFEIELNARISAVGFYERLGYKKYGTPFDINPIGLHIKMYKIFSDTMKKKMLIASTSTIYGGNYLEYLHPALSNFLTGVSQILFIPFAQPGGISYQAYTQKAQKGFEALGIAVKGIHQCENPQQALKEAQAIFVGGGNTFLLVKMLYQTNLMQTLKEVVEAGTPYVGTSAGSNITGISMQTTNDMPIVFPPSFQTLGAVPFNINPHYLDPQKVLGHMGETRETRILEFHKQNAIPVVGLREGSYLQVEEGVIRLRGGLPARIFLPDQSPYELPSESIIKI